MSEPKVHVPRRRWWVVAVAVPLVVAALAVSPKLVEVFQNGGSREPISDRVVIRESVVHADDIVGGDLHEGDEVRTEIALTFVGATPELSPEEREILDGALDRLKRGDFDGAIPVLRAAAEKTPTQSLLNNLAAAHLAVGETAAAQQAIEKARALGDQADLDVNAALNWNERRLARSRTYRLKPITAVHKTQWQGIEAYLTRAEDTGGMITIEAVFLNATTAPVSFCPSSVAHLIDERSQERWGKKYASHINCNIVLPPAGLFPIWMKFPVDVAEHPRVTVVIRGILPFEGVEPTTGGGG